uniref:Protein kinase domain-containing protein n=1 Tax=Panagrellus redivivus TaxID=6233 RepID=A0A7E4ZVZ7_PANRE
MGASEQEDDIGIKPGAIITSGKYNWVVVKLLGEGGFGAVYKVHDSGDKSQEYAMKVEKKLEKRKHSKLKMEVAILKEMNGKPEYAKHFTNIVDRGKKEKYFFICMTLVGKSLDDLKRERPNRVFTMATAIGGSIQCLEAVAAMHKCGYIHRDLKPANYACGLGKERRIVFLLDFGIARRITNDDNELKTPRAQVGFKGTVRFASLACHHNKEMGPKDDCESWYYLLIDLSCPSGLPWRKLSDKNDVMSSKEEIRSEKGLKRFLSDLPLVKTEFVKILQYVDRLEYSDRVDYNFIYELMALAAINARANLDDPYDWEEEGKNKAESFRSRRCQRSLASQKF